jgi:hypothetical protein
VNIKKNKKIIKAYLSYVATVGRFYHWFFNSILFRPFVSVFKIVGIKGFGSDACLKKGYLPMPVHFYSPVPDIDDLEKRKIWEKRSDLKGIDFNEKKQFQNLSHLGYQFQKECHWPNEATENPSEYFINNDGFSYGCAAILHSMIREYKPKKLIEIGSGNSSKVISKALELNRIKNGVQSHYTIIDPYPPSYVARKTVKVNKLYKKRVELLDPKIFETLGDGDILFIDSSHSVKIGGDVNYLYLEILPRLKPEVVVHIHDINIPYEYPKAYATSEVFRQFWTEQYLLQSFLSLNNEFEILLAMGYLMHDYPQKFQKAFPYYDPKIHHLTSGSFWMRRKTII